LANCRSGDDGKHLPLLVLDLGLDVIDGIRGLNLEGDGLAGEGLHEDLHGGCVWMDVLTRRAGKKGDSKSGTVYVPRRSLKYTQPR